MRKRDGRAAKLLAVLGLLVLAPVCAEYIQAYDDSTGNFPALLFALVIFAPLYGAPAVLLRELARRFDVRWPGIIALATGFGILQAGVIDQSLFSTGYRDIAYWDAMIRPTWIEPLGLSLNASMVFVLGHTIWSFSIPIALTESLSGKQSRAPWLRWPGLTVMTVLYLAAAALIMSDAAADGGGASPGQLAGSLAVVGLLALFAFTLGRRFRVRHDRKVPAPILVGVVATALALGFNFSPSSVPGTVAMVAMLAVTVAAVTWLSGSHAWTGRHVAALAGGALLGRVIIGFLADPLGDVTATAQLAHNLVFLAMALGLWLWSARSPGRALLAESTHRVG